MSHITKIKSNISESDLSYLATACDIMGHIFEKGAKTFKYYYGDSKCDHKIKVEGAKYEIGLVKEKDTYNFVMDEYSTGGLVKKVGRSAGLIVQRMNAEKAKALARRKGFTVTESIDDKNNIVLKARLL